MAVTVKLRFVHHSARKLRPVIEMFGGKNLETSIERTSVMPQESAQILNKALKMAKSSAEQKQFSASQMVISEIFATEGPRVKRIRANSRGRTNKYQKKLAHLTVTLVEDKSAVQPKMLSKPKSKVETIVRKKAK